MAKRVLFWLLTGGALLVAVAMFVNAILSSQQASQLDERLAKLRQAGAPVELADLRPTTELSSSENAAVSLQRGAAGIAVINTKLAAMYADPGYESGRFGESQQQLAAQALDAAPDAVALIEQAADCREYQSLADFQAPANGLMERQMNQVQVIRGAFRILDAKSRLEAARGEFDESIETSRRLLRLSRLYGREPTMVCYLVSIAGRGIGAEAANRALWAGRVSSDSHEALAAELNQHDLTAAWRDALHGERAFNLAARRDLPRGPFGRSRDLHSVLDLHEAFEQALTAKGLNGAARPPRLPPIAASLAPALTAAQSATVRTEAVFRCLRLVNELTNADPAAVETIDAKALSLAAHQIIDPYDGKSLKLRKGDRGWIVYTVGMDGVDDGGSIDDFKDIGLGPPRPAK